MNTAATLRTRAAALAAPLPPLLAQADHLAATVMLGMHGRKRAGPGDEFWQYRWMQPGDTARMIDWRRSARADRPLVREREWKIAQSVLLWMDGGGSMGFASHARLPQKRTRAQLLSLALAILLLRAGERVGLTDKTLPPRRGEGQIALLARALLTEDTQEYGLPQMHMLPLRARAVLVSDFLGDVSAVRQALGAAAARGVRGALVQVLDPAEAAFPYRGRVRFQSVGGGLNHETQKADDLRDRYLTRLAERQDTLRHLCRNAGWQYECHLTSRPAQQALLWLFRALGGAQAQGTPCQP